MLLQEVIQLLDNGTKTDEVANMIEVPVKRFYKGLKNAGYIFDNSTKRWYYTGTDAEPLDTSILDFIPRARSNTKVIQKSADVITNGTSFGIQRDGTSIAIGNNPFTEEEISALKQLAHQFITSEAVERNKSQLKVRIAELSKGSRNKKTYLVKNDVAARINKLAEREKLIKSDLIELALLDFLERYELRKS